jgi:hypothetical protein
LYDLHDNPTQVYSIVYFISPCSLEYPAFDDMRRNLMNELDRRGVSMSPGEKEMLTRRGAISFMLDGSHG